MRIPQVRVSRVRISRVWISQVWVSQVRVSQVWISQVRIPQMRVSQVRIWLVVQRVYAILALASIMRGRRLAFEHEQPIVPRSLSSRNPNRGILTQES